MKALSIFSGTSRSCLPSRGLKRLLSPLQKAHLPNDSCLSTCKEYGRGDLIAIGTLSQFRSRPITVQGSKRFRTEQCFDQAAQSLQQHPSGCQQSSMPGHNLHSNPASRSSTSNITLHEVELRSQEQTPMHAEHCRLTFPDAFF